MDKLENEWLHSIGKKFGDNLDHGVEQGYWPVVINCLRSLHLGDKSDEGRVQGFKISNTLKKVIAELVDFRFNDILAMFDEFPIKPIRPRGLIRGHVLNN